MDAINKNKALISHGNNNYNNNNIKINKAKSFMKMHTNMTPHITNE